MTTCHRCLGLLLLIVSSVAAHAQLPSPTVLLLQNTGIAALSLRDSQLLVQRGDVAVNSTDSWAMTPTSSVVKALAGALRVVGGFHADGASTVAPQPVTGAPAAADPYANGPQWPAADRVASAEELFLDSDSEQTLQPGVYMGGLSAIGEHIKIHFAPGVYFIHNGDVFLDGAEVDGRDVTIILYGKEPGCFTVRGTSQVKLSAPREGPLQNLLVVVGGRQDGLQVTFDEAVTELDGVIYAPVSGVALFSGAQVKASAVVAWSLTLLEKSRLEVTGQRVPATP